MRKLVIMAIVLVILLALIDFAHAEIRINEIMYNPAGDDNNHEFVELFMDAPENLTGWIIADPSSNDSLELLQYSDSSYALIVEEGFDFTGINASVYSAGATIGNNLDNTADEIFFYTPNTTLVASAHYDGSIANNNGYSMELVDREWLESSEIGGTPGRENTAKTETNSTDEANQTNSAECSFDVSTDKDLYNNSEKVKINFEIEPEPGEFIIEYWVEDLAGNIAKAKYNTTNTDQKSWTPSIEEEDKSFYVKADLYSVCGTCSSKKLITVVGQPKPSESSIVIKEIYLGDDEAIEFGRALRIRLDIYKGDESSSTVEAWIEDLDSSEKVSDISKLTLYEKFREYDLTIPVQVKNNCDKKYSDGSYTLIVKGFNITEKEGVRVEGIVSSLCPDSAVSEETEAQKISYEIAEFNEEVIAGEEFTTKISIRNEDENHKFTLWSYVYRGSKSYSGEREQNMVTVELDPGEAKTVDLANLVEEAEPGDYKLKIKIQKDDLKTTNDLTKDILISSPPEERNNSIDFEIAALVSKSNASNNSNNASGSPITGEVVYISSSSRAKKLAPYFMVAAVAVIAIIIITNRKKLKKRKTQRL